MIENIYKRLLTIRWKWAYPIAFLIFSLWVYGKISVIMDFLTTNYILSPFNITKNKALYILATLGILGLLFAIYISRTPLVRRRVLYKRFSQAGIKNDHGEVPLLHSSHHDKKNPYMVIDKIANNGVSEQWLRDHIHDVKAAIRAEVCQIKYTKSMKYIIIGSIKTKYIKPTIISRNSSFISQKSNMLVVGATGTGKSLAMLHILTAYLKCYPFMSVTISDFKNDERFSILDGAADYYGYNRAADGIRSVYKEFRARLEAGNSERNKCIHLLLIDEWSLLLASLETKEANELKSIVSQLLFGSRSLGFIVIVGLQRADSKLFDNGGRDQFTQILALGNLSKEQKSMLFSDYKDMMTDINATGEGYILVDGKPLSPAKVAKIADIDSFVLNVRGSIYH